MNTEKTLEMLKIKEFFQNECYREAFRKLFEAQGMGNIGKARAFLSVLYYIYCSDGLGIDSNNKRKVVSEYMGYAPQAASHDRKEYLDLNSDNIGELKVEKTDTIMYCKRKIDEFKPKKETSESKKEIFNKFYEKVFQTAIPAKYIPSVISIPEVPSVENVLKILQLQGQIILYGPPGTGKTRMAECVAKEICGIVASNIKKVQFHPSYDYYDFVEGIVATKNGFQYKSKVLRDMAEKARNNSDKSYVLIIDEINRAQISSVVGECLYGLEYRESDVTTLIIDKPLEIPKNLYIIGTMNTADKSLSQMDYALRRRFAFINIPAGYSKEISEAIERAEKVDYCDIDGGEKIFHFGLFKMVRNDILKSVSKGVNPEDIIPGISYFICDRKDKSIDNEHLNYKIKYELIPLLKEYMKNGMFSKRNKLNGMEGSMLTLLESGEYYEKIMLSIKRERE